MGVLIGYFVLLVITLTGISNFIIGFLGVPIQWLQFSRDTGNVVGSGVFWLFIYYFWYENYNYSMPLLAMVIIGVFYYGLFLNAQQKEEVHGVRNDLMGQTAGFFLFSIGYLIYFGIRYSEFNWV
jgi:hypothetical protein